MGASAERQETGRARLRPRSTRGPHLRGLRVGSLAALLEALGGPEAVSGWLVTDLSLGAWQGQQVGRDLCAQLGLPTPGGPAALGEYGASMAMSKSKETTADLIGVFIDSESGGSSLVRTALALVEQVLERVSQGPPRTFLAFAPLGRSAWEVENVLLLRFLADGLRETPHRLWLVSTGDTEPVLPSGWTADWRTVGDARGPVGKGALLGLVPGLIEPELAKRLDPSGQTGTLRLASGHLLVAPESRRPVEACSRSDFDRLGAAVKDVEWLSAYSQCHGNNYFSAPFFLCQQAWTRFTEGGYGISDRLMARAAACAHAPDARGRLLWELQGMRIAAQRFEEAARVDDPPPSMKREDRGGILQTKGWALTLLQDAKRGEPYLRQARELLSDAEIGVRPRLYLMNIHALSRLRTGDYAGALAIEKEIEQRLSELTAEGRRDWHLEYINFINQARLYRQAKDFESCERYYGRAFETTLGVRAESDLVYAHACLARMETARGRTSDAFLGWLRSALYWLSARVPEALANRASTALLQRTVHPHEIVVEEISATLEKELRASALATQRPELARGVASAEGAEAPAFISLEPGGSPPPLRALVGGPGWSVLCTDEVLPAALEGEAYKRLGALVHQLLQVLGGAEDLARSGTLVVDDRLGHELAMSEDEAWETCVRLSIPRMVFDGRVKELTPEERERLERGSRVRLGSAVRQVTGSDEQVRVVFKRYLSARTVEGEQARLLRALDREPTVAELCERHAAPDRVIEALHELRRLRMVELHPGQTFSQARSR